MTADEKRDPKRNAKERMTDYPADELELEAVDPRARGEAPEPNGRQSGEAEPALPEPAKPNIATFRGIPKKLHESLKQTAADLGVSPGELARYFLEYGLDRIEAGEELVTPEFVPGGYTLYPGERPKQARRKSRRKPKTQQQPRSYYGVPREVVKQVLAVSQSLGVTQGELARYLFERGLALYREGKLTLKPVPVQQIATLYPEDLQQT